MSAEEFEVIAVVVPNPEFNPATSKARIVNQTIGFQDSSTNIRTLSATNPNKWNKIQGLLYVPELPQNSTCINVTRPYVPNNVTRIQDLDGSSYPVIAFAPWTSPNCTQEYFKQMRTDNARAAIWFLPGNDEGEPPTVNDPEWELNDGGAWLETNQFPIYALPGAVGSYMMTSLAEYSGNLTDEPYGAQLVQQYDARDFVRLWATIPVDNGTAGIPSLWVFLIIVLAVLLFVVISTSFIMHLVQARHRRVLQRRVANGEVDLEALGIKRLNVPQEVLDKMPQYVYTPKAESETESAINTSKSLISKTTPATINSRRIVQFSQPTCPICLDDFIPAETTIRELPCNHIFHPECIDPFLKENSSLCPMCKKSALPPGYCPIQITNLMVRRERLIRRMRQRVRIVHGEEIGGLAGAYGRRRRLYDSMTNRFHVDDEDAVQRRRYAARMSANSAELASTRAGQVVEMVNVPHEESYSQSNTNVPPEVTVDMAAVSPAEDLTPPAEIQRQGTAARRAWRRERLASVQASAYDRQARAADEAVGSTWKRVLGKIFPSSR